MLRPFSLLARRSASTVYFTVRDAVQIEGLSKRAVARRFGIDPKIADKMKTFFSAPGYVRMKPQIRPTLDLYIAIIDKILADDKSRPEEAAAYPHPSSRALRPALAQGLQLPVSPPCQFKY